MGAEIEEDGLKRLEYLSLVSKVCSELETHIGVADKVLGEFITEMGRNCETVDEFDAKLKESGAEMPDYFVRTLLTIIHAILPPLLKSGSDKDDAKEAEKSGKFSALKIKDDKERVKELEREIELETRKNRGNDGDEYRRDREGRRDRRRERDADERRDMDRDGRRDREDRRDREREDRRDREREDRRDRDRGDRREKGRDADYKSHNRDRDRYEGRKRREYDEEDRDEDRRNAVNGSDEPELYKVYKGRVSRVMETGCFVQLDECRGKEGLVHVSQMATRRVANAKDLVKRDQEVYVKLYSVSGQKLSLSMRDVDQKTGKDLLSLKKNSLDDNDGLRENPSGRNMEEGIRILEEDDIAVPSRRPLKKTSSPERWEAKQLMASGVLPLKEHPMFDEEGDGFLYEDEGAEEELEIELNEDEPPFLQGQSRYSVDMSPVKIFKNPEGSLSRAAALQSALIKERREVREQQQRAMLDSIPKDLNRPWEDPMPESGERHLVQELRGVGLSAYDMPEWKKDAYGKTLTFGQRQSLPIYKLKNELGLTSGTSTVQNASCQC